MIPTFGPLLPAEETQTVVRLPTEAPRRRRSERLAIWDLPGTCHCVTIGTCLTLAELRRLAVRLDLFKDAGRLTDYELHGAFVHAMGDRNRVSIAIQKLLDSKHAGIVRRVARAGDDAALEALWDEAVTEGLVPGAFWALITHPGLGAALEKRIFGEVHMMSHLCGASHRGDARAIAVIDRQRRQLAARLAERGEEERCALADRDREIARLKRLVTTLEPFIHQVDALKRELETLRAAEERVDPAALPEVRALRTENDLLRATVARAEASAAEWERRAERLGDQLAVLVSPERAPVARPCAEACPLNLAGRSIAYIGGRPQTIARIRSLVERCNGCLLTHDGGTEQSAQVLDGILAQADIVVVPVTCVSHNAMEKARAACERQRKVFAPLASASFSAFAVAIGDLSTEASGATA